MQNAKEMTNLDDVLGELRNQAAQGEFRAGLATMDRLEGLFASLSDPAEIASVRSRLKEVRNLAIVKRQDLLERKPVLVKSKYRSAPGAPTWTWQG